MINYNYVRLICIKSEQISFPIRNTIYNTVEGKEYCIIVSSVTNDQENYYFLNTKTIDNLIEDVAICNINNFITMAEWREKQMKSILDE